MATPICDSQPPTKAPVVPAAPLSPIIVNSRMTTRLLAVPSNRKALSSVVQPAMRSVAPLPSNTRSCRSVRRSADDSLYVPPALNAIVEPSGTERMNDASAPATSLAPLASIDAGTLTVAPVVGGAVAAVVGFGVGAGVGVTGTRVGAGVATVPLLAPVVVKTLSPEMTSTPEAVVDRTR